MASHLIPTALARRALADDGPAPGLEGFQASTPGSTLHVALGSAAYWYGRAARAESVTRRRLVLLSTPPWLLALALLAARLIGV